MEKFDVTILKRERKNKGWSYNYLSAMTVLADPKRKGIVPATCNKVLRGEYDPSTRTLTLLCAAMGVPVRDCFGQR